MARVKRHAGARVATPYGSPAVFAALALVALFMSPGCARHGEARWHACRCEFATDFDQPGEHSVEVCAEREQAAETAQSCARDHGVGAVGDCRCAETSERCAATGTLCRER